MVEMETLAIMFRNNISLNFREILLEIKDQNQELRQKLSKYEDEQTAKKMNLV